jgi:hypothetical protein
MRFDEVMDMLLQLIATWQVIAVTVVVILYFSLVFYVAKLHRRARPPSVPKKKKKKAETVPAPEAAEIEGDASRNAGIEEEVIIEE